MALYRTTQALHSITGLPEDDVMTTYHWETTETGPSTVTAAALNGHVAASWNAIHAPGSGFASAWLSAEISRSALPTCKTYSILGGSPLAVNDWLAFAASAAPKSLPAEVACCLSYNADLTNILEEAPDDADSDTAPERPASRRRGRIFVGPLSDQATANSGAARPVAAFQNDLLGLGWLLANPSNATLTAVATKWIVWSPESTTGAANEIVRVSVDNAWDTQRRRGVAPSARVTLSV